MRYLVLGAGMIGSVIAADLASDGEDAVTIADSREGALRLAGERCRGRARTRVADLSRPEVVRALAHEHDVVVGALASHLAFSALNAVIESGKSYCDIAFMPEDPLELDSLARARGVTCVVDMGVAPGMSNLLAGVAARRLDPCEEISIMVGGLPKVRTKPFEYKAGFSPADVLEEYTRPARQVEGSRVVTREALSQPELVDFPGVGTLEAFNTDGLRSLARTLRVPWMREKTLRYPGHIDLMRAMRTMGLFSKDPIDVGGVRVRPIDVTSALLFPHWAYAPGEPDLTVMRVEATGSLRGARTRLRWDLHDELDPATNFTSMARTTAFPCAIVARLIGSGRLRRAGVLAPETLADDDGLVEHLMGELGARGVAYRHWVEPAI